jgi:hypothetical protein
VERGLFSWSEFLCVQIGTSSIEGYVDSIFIALCVIPTTVFQLVWYFPYGLQQYLIHYGLFNIHWLANDHEIEFHEIKSLFFSGGLKNDHEIESTFFLRSKVSKIFDNFDQEIES